jgi:triphosphoribosyl-dephospho-CoA synthase
VSAGAEIGAAAQLACLLEASAPKPGNVSPGRPFPDATYEDFLASAVAIGTPLAGAGTRPLGATVRLAIESTRRWTRSNTNLGIVLLLAPLARAALGAASGQWPMAALRDAVRNVLAETTVRDACDVYAAIRQAAPGGLGTAAAQDIADEPTVTLLQAMSLAADRDGVAREYTSTFEMTFAVGAPALRNARQDGLGWSDAIVEAFLMLLAARPDTHITRRAGSTLAATATRLAGDVLARGGVRSADGRAAIEVMDRELRDARHLGNPGTTADLTTASVFVVLLDLHSPATDGAALGPW